MSTKIDDDTLYDVAGLAKILGVTEKTVERCFLKENSKERSWEGNGMPRVQPLNLILMREVTKASQSDK